MKQVISASRRTDIPAFYLKWFMEHIRAGEIEVTNPFNRKQVKKVSLSPRDVAWIVFWSRNYSHFLTNAEAFDNYRLYFHFTINPADKLLEPDMISPAIALRQLEALVSKFGPESVVWRYDPFAFYRTDGEIRSNHNIRVFRRFVKEASRIGLQRCYVSIVSLYPKVLKRAARVPGFRFEATGAGHNHRILQEVVDLASLYGVRVYSCSDNSLLEVNGMKEAHCIDGKLLNRLGHQQVSERRHPGRRDCGCTLSIDIGDYLKTPCKYHCLYCYAR
jgi:hypothetical protein